MQVILDQLTMTTETHRFIVIDRFDFSILDSALWKRVPMPEKIWNID